MEAKNAISTAIGDWAKSISSSGKIVRAYNLKGGWESWAQVELAIAIQDAVKSKTDDGATIIQNVVTRENYVYEPFVSPITGKKVEKKDDILISTIQTPKFGHHDPITKWTNIIELKCQSSGNKDNFVNDVESDMEKIELNKIKAEFLPTYGWILAISVGSDSHAKLETLAATRNAAILKKHKEEAGARANPKWDEWVKEAKYCKVQLGKEEDQVFLWGWRMDLAHDAKTFYWYW